jgi:hypothetical protein
MTAGPDKIDFVLHDPPGSNSFASISKGISTKRTESIKWSLGAMEEGSLGISLGTKTGAVVGLGVSISTETVNIDAKAGVFNELTFQYTGNKTSETVSTFTESLSTSPSPDFVGHEGDVFVGHSVNYLYGNVNAVAVLKTANKQADDEEFAVSGDYMLGKTVAVGMGEKLNTVFYYTQTEIESNMLPKWEDNLRKLFVFGDPAAYNPATLTAAVYVSHLPADDENFGKRNDDKDAFGDEAKDGIEGPSYTLVLPKTLQDQFEQGWNPQGEAQGEIEFTDSVFYFHKQIERWKEVMADNEKNKVNARYVDNISFGGGATIEKNETKTEESMEEKGFNEEFKLGVYVENKIQVFGVGLALNLKTGITESAEATWGEGSGSENSFSFTLEEDGTTDDLTVDYGRDPVYQTWVFKTRGGQTSCPYEGEYRTRYYQPGNHILAEATMQIEMPRIEVKGGANRVQVPGTREAKFVLQMTNESETNTDRWYVLTVDDSSNPYGAVLKIDGAAIGNGRRFLVKAGEALEKTLTVGKGPEETKYENIRLILASECQYDMADVLSDIFSDVYVSAEFVPACSEAEILAPKNNWIVNTATGDSLWVEIGSFDRNYANFDHIELQYRPVASPDWYTLMSFFADQGRYDNSPTVAAFKTLIGNEASIKYLWDMTGVSDGQYEIRAYSSCKTTGGVPVSENYSDEVTGWNDMSRPTPLGYPSPTNGILNAGGEISILFNEDIQPGLLIKDNFKITGVLNAEKRMEPTVGLAFTGTENAYTELPIFAGGSFSIETWIMRSQATAGTLFAFGEGDTYFSLGFDAVGHAIVKVGEETHASADTITVSEVWKYISLSYNREENTVSVYAFEETQDLKLLLDEKLTLSPATKGRLYVGNTAAGGNEGFRGAVGMLHFYDTARTLAEASASKNETKSGREANLIGLWELEEGEGAIGKDKARARNLTLNTSWYIYPAGKSLAFNGTNQYAKLESGTFPFRSYDDFSWEFWFRGDNQGAATLLSCGTTAFVGFNAAGELILTASSGAVQTLRATSLLDGQWHHFALSVKRNGNTNAIVDGTVSATFNSSIFSGSVGGGFYHLGAKYFEDLVVTGTNGYTEYFKGNIDEIRVWNLALPTASILLDKNHKLTGNETGLKAYYPFEQYERQSNGLILVTESLNDMVTGITATTPTTPTLYDEGVNIQDCRPVTEVPFTFTASSNKVVLELSSTYDYKVEGVTLSISAEGIRDMRNNQSQPIAWIAYVNRNTLRWDTEDLNLVMEESKMQSFNALISNVSGETTDYIIENSPDWLTVDAPQGTLIPLAVKTLKFNVSSGLNIGSYEVSLVLTSPKGIRDVLNVSLKVTGSRPPWTVNPFDFESTMNVTGQILINKVYQEDIEDVLAAFIDEQCVGVASPVYVKENNAYFTFMDVYGNSEHTGKNIRFKIWDASTGFVYPVVEFGNPNRDVVFQPSAIHGNTDAPIAHNALNVIEQEISLGNGWNWLSFNLTNNNPTLLTQFKESIANAGVLLKGETAYIQYANNVWTGSLTEINLEKMYILNTNKQHTLQVNGAITNPQDKPITLVTGWNWIGYVPLFTLPVNSALASLNPQTGDQIKGHTGYRTYMGATGWIGSLNYMQPGYGYMYYSSNVNNQTLVYPSSSNQRYASPAPAMQMRSATETTVDKKWTVDHHRFPNSMTTTAIVLINNIEIESAAIEIAAFSGDDCRGSALLQHVEGLENPYMGFLMIYGNEGNEEIKFRIYDHSTGLEYNAQNTPILFSTDAIHGNPAEPYRIVAGTTGINNPGNKAFNIYPNPVSGVLFINHTWEKIDALEISDLIGRRIISESDFTKQSINVSGLVKGIYILKLRKGNQIFVEKFTKK